VAGQGVLRIGELSRRSGVSPELLRAWERRYHLLRPTRSSGGLRLYSLEDLERVRAMQQHLASGLAAAEAAVLATQAEGGPADALRGAEESRDELASALAAFDEPRTNALLDTLLASRTLDWVLSSVVLPYLHELGRRWQRGEASIAQEHFATGVLRGRLLGLARDWSRGLGPRVVLACPPGEQHDLGLIAFGLALHSRGWRIIYLGADTPIDSVIEAAEAFAPTSVVISAVNAEAFGRISRELRALARGGNVYLGGGGAHDLDDIGAVVLGGDPIEEADRLTALVNENPR
jgi:MerR family transcriptional regulator, light-induced transcriptional regulator